MCSGWPVFEKLVSIRVPTVYHKTVTLLSVCSHRRGHTPPIALTWTHLQSLESEMDGFPLGART